MAIDVHSAGNADRRWLAELWHREWGAADFMVSRRVHRLADLSALIAWEDGVPVGALTYAVDSAGCEMVSLNATVEGRGVGTALLDALTEVARAEGCRRIWLITTNDNLEAMRFYQRHHFRFSALLLGAADAARALKKSIPDVGEHGIAVHDFLELELPL